MSYRLKICMSTYVQLKPLMEGLVMHMVDFSFTSNANSGKVLNMLDAKVISGTQNRKTEIT
jgi:hypothetical protein